MKSDNNNKEIEVSQTTEPKTATVHLPVNFITSGHVENDDIKVYIRQDVYQKIEQYADSDTSRELGSILIGGYVEELGKTHVIVSDFIEAKYTDASASTLTFTHESWEFIHSEQSRLYPDKKIIGWQHTHPNYGIFLSNYDMFIQENFFNLPFQIAYVVDPVQHTRGFFQWKNEKVQKLEGFYIYDEVGKPIKITQNQPAEKNGPSGKISNRALVILCSFLTVASMVLCVSFISQKSRYNDFVAQQQIINDDLSYQIDNQRKLIDTQNKALADTKKQLEDRIGEESKYIYFKKYIIEKGDSLYSICKKNGITYNENISLILTINGIDNPGFIQIGQTILLPVKQDAK